jgi:DNA-directed RNA polymerase beta' subunit
LEHERWENNILSIVGSFKSVGSSIMEKLPDDNAFKIMAESGSKGDASNVAQMNGGLGQTMFMGKRLKFAITHGTRITAHYEPNSLDLDARGFIDSNFLEGLTAPELFMHFMWAREGILDTALKTGDTGYVHHKIVKHLEDNTVKYDGSVRNAAGRIIQFHYAEDGFNGAETMTLNTSYGKMTTFYNFKQQSKRLNRMFGF